MLLHGEIRPPPLSIAARIEVGTLLRQLQKGTKLALPYSRPMPIIGSRCHELRVDDAESRLTWRLIYRIDTDAVVIAAVFAKKIQKIPRQLVQNCMRRYKQYDLVLKRQHEKGKG